METKALIICAVTVQLICTFIFACAKKQVFKNNVCIAFKLPIFWNVACEYVIRSNGSFFHMSWVRRESANNKSTNVHAYQILVD